MRLRQLHDAVFELIVDVGMLSLSCALFSVVVRDQYPWSTVAGQLASLPFVFLVAAFPWRRGIWFGIYAAVIAVLALSYADASMARINLVTAQPGLGAEGARTHASLEEFLSHLGSAGWNYPQAAAILVVWAVMVAAWKRFVAIPELDAMQEVSREDVYEEATTFFAQERQENSKPAGLDDAISSAEVALLLVHGTFAAHAEDAGDRWWQTGSPVREALLSRIRPYLNVGNEAVVFHWLGDNLESSRAAGAEALCRQLLTLEKLRRPYHLITFAVGQQ
jgi:hypothetical protein